MRPKGREPPGLETRRRKKPRERPMGKADKKQKRRPKFKDKKQSDRFKETAREIGADESSDARIV